MLSRSREKRKRLRDLDNYVPRLVKYQLTVVYMRLEEVSKGLALVQGTSFKIHLEQHVSFGLVYRVIDVILNN
jgi:hypothetical protein